ncbi:MAG TPA: YihY/virulence factor BrkB family protein [Chthoniobacterales bacterium]|nr:YihY/virulence factor BrkB family protein [Chthoniobacterales bacterium]
MDSSESEKRQLSGSFVISRQQLSESYKDVRAALGFDRYRHSLRKGIGENICAWMSVAAILGWVLSRIPAKKEKVFLLRHEESHHLGGKKIRKRNRKGKFKLLSSAVELVLAVSLKVLVQHLKSWSRGLTETNRASREVVGSGSSSKTERETLTGTFDRSHETNATHRANKLKPAGFVSLFRKTAEEFIQDKCPQLGAALAYYTVFSLAPMVLVLLAVFGLIYGGSEQAREKVTDQLRYLLDPSGVKVFQDIAANASEPKGGILAVAFGIIFALFGASGVFGQLQDALNTIWGVKPKPGGGIWGFLRARFLSFAMVGGVCFLLLVSLTVESALRGMDTYLESMLPGGHFLALAIFFLLDLTVIILLFAMIFRYLPDVKIGWRDVWFGAALTAGLFATGKFILGLYLGSGAAGSAYGAASSLITLLLWIFYSAQILLFGAEFTQVYASAYGSQVKPQEHAVMVERREIEVPANDEGDEPI